MIKLFFQIRDITQYNLPPGLSDLTPGSNEVLEALIVSTAPDSEPFLRAVRQLGAEDVEASIVSIVQRLIFIFTLTATSIG